MDEPGQETGKTIKMNYAEQRKSLRKAHNNKKDIVKVKKVNLKFSRD